MSRAKPTDLVSFTSDRSLSFLLSFLLVLMFVVYPFFALEGIGRYVVDIALSLVLISGAFAIDERRWRRFAVGLLVVTLLTRWATYLDPSHQLLVVNSALTIVFLGFSSVTILSRVLAAGDITRHRIEGAVAVYLLIGLTFTMVYTLMTLLDPGAFTMSDGPAGLDARGFYDDLAGRLSYFSFVTLTTVGYGDVTPVSSLARQFAVLEGLIGQLFPAILLARLVSLEIASRGE